MSGIYILYTGGTFGMDHLRAGDPTSPLGPKPISAVATKLTELLPDFSIQLQPNRQALIHGSYKQQQLAIDWFDQPIDSSDISPPHWQKIARRIAEVYADYDQFVIIHGTDTMAYTASALSFMLLGIAKPLVLTGANTPIFKPESDAPANFRCAIDALLEGKFTKGVWLAYEQAVMLGVRVTKFARSKTTFTTLKSSQKPVIVPPKEFALQTELYSPVIPVYMHPGWSAAAIKALLSLRDCGAYLFLTYGGGNYPQAASYQAVIKQAIAENKTIANLSQCPAGKLLAANYATSFGAIDPRIMNLGDMTIEAALTKLMWAKANLSAGALKEFMEQNQAGELSG